MAELLQLISDYGVQLIIIALFVWDWLENKKSIRNSLEENSKANSNISKSLELLQKNMENTESKLDEHDKRGILILNALEEIKSFIKK